MKKILSLLLLTLIFALAFTSCTALKGAFVKCEVKFDLDGGVADEGFIESVTVKYGKTISMPTPTRDNYTFMGWYADGELYTSTTAITKDVVLKAEWSFNETYKITYNTNGKGENIPADFVKLGTLPQIPTAPQVEGYVFAGWYLDEALTERYYFDYALDADTTLHANFYDTQLGEYIVISTFEQLAAIKDDPAAKYLLACDINCHGEAITPINEFTGELHGNGYKIYDFTISDTALTSGFIRTNKGTIKDLTFKDFVIDVLVNAAADKNYGAICGINEGVIENCDVVDGDLRVNDSLISQQAVGYSHIGGIIGNNSGIISNCSSLVNITVKTYSCASSAGFNINKATHHYIFVGGVTGTNNDGGTVNCCVSKGNIETESETVSEHTEYRYMETIIYVGGISGRNYGEINSSINTGNMKIDFIDPSAAEALYIYVGNAVGLNNGKIRGCYTTGNIEVFGAATTSWIGGFVGENYLQSGYSAMINKCFSIGSIIVDNVPTNYGYFVGATNGTEKHCYYLDTVTINQKTVVDDVETLVALEPTTKVGEAKTIEELLSVDFILNTLNFDRMEWFIVDGKLPELR